MRWLHVLPLALARDDWLPESASERLGRESCLQRLRDTDFAAQGFRTLFLGVFGLCRAEESVAGAGEQAGDALFCGSKRPWEAFIDCLYRLRTRWRPREKAVYAGGVHYPTLITAHHTWPPVSTSGSQLCWLDELGDSAQIVISELKSTEIPSKSSCFWHLLEAYGAKPTLSQLKTCVQNHHFILHPSLQVVTPSNASWKARVR